VDIVGHTDYRTSASSEKLSLQRAEAVKAWLVKKGVSSSRLATKGMGALEPVASNDTPEGRERNKRIEVRVK